MAYKNMLKRGGGGQGNFLLQRDSGLVLKRPNWNHSTEFRIFPAPLGDGVAPYRLSADPGDYSEWIEAVEVASFIGVTRKVTFIDAIPDDPDQIQVTPLSMLISTMYNKPSGFGIRWEAYPDMSDRNAPVKKSKPYAFVQGALLLEYINDKAVNYLSKKSPLVGVVLQVPKSAARSLQALLEERVAEYTGDPTDWASRYKHGNLLDPAKGSSVTIRQKRDEEDETSGDVELTLDMAQSAAFQGGGDFSPQQMTFKTYEVIPARRMPLPAGMVHKHWKPWDSVLNIMTPDKQVELLCTAFPDDLMRAAFHTKPEWLPESIRSGKVISVPKTTMKDPVEDAELDSWDPKIDGSTVTDDQEDDADYFANFTTAKSDDGGDDQVSDLDDPQATTDEEIPVSERERQLMEQMEILRKGLEPQSK